MRGAVLPGPAAAREGQRSAGAGGGRGPARAVGSDPPDGAQARLVEAVVAAAGGADLDPIEQRRDDRALPAQVERVPGFAEGVAVADVAVKGGGAGELAELLACGGQARLDRLAGCDQLGHRDL